MNELVFMKGKQPVTTSLIIAEGTGNEHESIMRIIKEHKADFEELWGKIYFSDLKSGNKNGDLRGRPTKIAWLNEQQATFLITLLRNNRIVVEFKKKLVDRFYKMREILLNQQNAEWREVRQAGKQSNKKLCAAIHEVIIPLARDAGSVTPDERFYQSYQKMLNKTLGIKPRSRDELPLALQYEVDKCHTIAEISIRGRAAQGKQYKQIFQDTKQTLENYARLSFIPERFLPA